VPTLTYI